MACPCQHSAKGQKPACQCIPGQGLKRGPKSLKYSHWTELTTPMENQAEVTRSRQRLVEEIMGAAATEPVSI